MSTAESRFNKLVAIADGVLVTRERERNQLLLSQYKTLVDQSAIVSKFDLSGQIIYVNDKFCDISGYASSQLLGKNICAFNHPSEPSENCAQMIARVSAGKQWAGLVRKRAQTGALYLVESRVVPIFDEQRQVLEVVSLDIDVTEQYKVYESLVDDLNETNHTIEEQRHFFAEYKRVLDLASSVCVTDLQHHILSANTQFETVIGYSAAQLKGQPISKIMPDAVAEHYLNLVQQPNQENFASRTVLFLDSHGQELQLSVSFVGIRDTTGRVESIVMICQDITDSTRLAREITETQKELLYMLSEVVESRSLETGQHIRRVAKVARFLALKIGLSEENAELIELAAPMHDIGKVGISDAILHKPGKLEPIEFEEMKRHTDIGHSILGKIDRPLIGMASVIAYQHHERFDGLGYPRGIQGYDISIGARITSVADVLDALSSARSYKPAWSEQRIKTYFLEERGHQFDPRLVDLLLQHWDTIQAIRNDSCLLKLPATTPKE